MLNEMFLKKLFKHFAAENSCGVRANYFGIPNGAMCAFKKFTTPSAVGFATNAAFGQLVLLSMDTSE